ncbi:hypothetical protein [Sphingomonas sp. ERG5]|nr:hypothetical protein [Sphingomonas sp. ERG5]
MMTALRWIAAIAAQDPVLAILTGFMVCAGGGVALGNFLLLVLP